MTRVELRGGCPRQDLGDKDHNNGFYCRPSYAFAQLIVHSTGTSESVHQHASLTCRVRCEIVFVSFNHEIVLCYFSNKNAISLLASVVFFRSSAFIMPSMAIPF